MNTPPQSSANLSAASGSGIGSTSEKGSPAHVAAAFVDAVAWGEHLEVWNLFSSEARHLVLRVAVTRGMDDRLAGRVRDGTATASERDTFLGDLVNGLRADLRAGDLDHLLYEADPSADFTDPDRAYVVLLIPTIDIQLGAPLPIASIELVKERGQWRVERLRPQVQR